MFQCVCVRGVHNRCWCHRVPGGGCSRFSLSGLVTRYQGQSLGGVAEFAVEAIVIDCGLVNERMCDAAISLCPSFPFTCVGHKT